MVSMIKIIRTIFLLSFFAAAQSASPQNAFVHNPVLAGCYPDPSICKRGHDYYLVTSSFAYYPGIPIFHSKDLAHWKQIGHVLDRPSQLNLDSAGTSRGLFAPAIRYHDGMFYLTCTLVDKGGNFLVTAKHPQGPWSEPHWLPEINGIDPSPFFDTDGKAYIIYNSIPPGDSSLYSGHRTIRMIGLDLKTLRTMGRETILVNGGTDLAKKPVWIEAPHIIKKNGWYYLIAAEGGTAEAHSEVVFRSRTLSGPYVPYEKNPILTQRHLDPARRHPITCTGHADFVQSDDGRWWAVFLGCRPYADDYYNTGRETFLLPVAWSDTDEWPVILSGTQEVPYRLPLPIATPDSADEYRLSGNLYFHDEFESAGLADDWIMLRTPRQRPWHSQKNPRGMLTLRVRPETCADSAQPSFIAYRQKHLRGTASTAMTFAPKSPYEKAGLAVFQNESRYYFLSTSRVRDTMRVELYKASGNNGHTPMELVASHNLPRQTLRTAIRLKIEADGPFYAFSYAAGKSKWNMLADSVSASWLSTKSAGGFIGCVYALYATSLGHPSRSVARYDWFDYQGNDDMYQEH